jgi:haloalkane dehalogenase
MLNENQSEAEKRFNLPVGLFPFKSRFLEIDGSQVHYVDEGQGPVFLMLHGNPTWSFVYRHLISALSSDFRCIAVDLPGFGLSRASNNFSYLPNDQTTIISKFLEALDIKNATLVAHDWGGPIGLAAMVENPTRITKLCLGNTWAWPVNNDFHFQWFSKLMGGPIGRFATDRFAFFINAMIPASMKRRKLSHVEMGAYRAPFAKDISRRAMHVFPQQIIGAKTWLTELEQEVSKFSGPVKIIWPEKDVAFRDKELRRWVQIFPRASVTRLVKCGHYLWEDAPEECIAAIREWV